MFNQIRYLPMNEGRWLNDMDDQQKRPVIVLGDEARRTMFLGRPAVGSTILLNGVRFEVIGTLQADRPWRQREPEPAKLRAVTAPCRTISGPSMWGSLRM